MAGMPVRRLRDPDREKKREDFLENRETVKSTERTRAFHAACAVLEAGIVPVCTTDKLLIELEAIRIGAMMTADWGAAIQAIMRKAEIHSGNTGHVQDARGFSSVYDLFAGILEASVQHQTRTAGKDSPSQAGIAHQPVPALGLGNGQNGYEASVASGEVQRGAEEPERVSRPLGEGALQVNHNNGGAVDTGHTEDPWEGGGWDGSVHRDIQPHEADSEGVPETDQNGAGN